MSANCLSCGKPLGSSSGICYSCRQDGVELEDVVEVDGEVVDRVERYFIVSSVRCSNCGELHESVTVDGETHTASTLGIGSEEEWQSEMDAQEEWLRENEDAVREALSVLESDWPESVRAVRTGVLGQP